MADSVRKINYCYLTVSNRAGQGEKVLAEVKNAGVNLLAYSGFPARGGKAQLDFVPENMAALRRVARKHGWRLSETKRGFLITGNDEVGAVHQHVAKLAAAKVSITAADAVIAGMGRYGMILWVKAKDYSRAATALNAK